MSAPEGVPEPLHWKLLTSLPCATLAQVLRVVGRYTARWWIEEYHKALKSGAGIEDSQLERADRLESLIAVLAVVAGRLLGAKLLARARPETFEAAARFGPEMLALLEQKIGHLTAAGRIGTCSSPRRDWEAFWPASTMECPAGKPYGAAGND